MVTGQRRTVYVIVSNRKGKRLGVTALKRLALDATAALPSWVIDRYHGDYVKGGTRFDVLDPFHHDPEDPGSSDSPCSQTPVLKVRGDEVMRRRVLDFVRRENRVDTVAGHDRYPA